MIARLWRRLRGHRGAEASGGSTLRDVLSAVTFGSEADAVRAAELWAMKVKEEEQAEAERARIDTSAKQIKQACEKTGVWFPPSDRWGRLR